jgi:hypothetical protein
MTDHEYEVVEQMFAEGGDFIKALARCLHHADDNNFSKLKAAFPEYWKQYEEIAARRKKHA